MTRAGTRREDAASRAAALEAFAAWLLLTAAVACLRWLTWRPFGAHRLAFDAAVIGAFVVAAALAPKFLPTRSALRVRPIGLLAAAVLAGSAAQSASVAWQGAAALVSGVASAGAIVVLLFGRARGVVSGVAASLGLALALLASHAGVLPGAVAGSVLPLVLLALAIAGVRAPSASDRRPSLAAALGSAALLGLLAVVPPAEGPPAREREATAPGSDERPSLVLVVLDTLRRDRMSLYGAERNTTPRLDAWARQALVFDAATATSSWTLPSHASMFTGLYSRSHGAHGYRSQRKKNSTYALAGEAVTLAEIASAAGFATGAIAANHYFLGPEFGVDQGFRDYWVPRPRRGFRLAPADHLAHAVWRDRAELYDWPYYRARFISDHALRWIERRGDTPYVLFVNYVDVHRPNRRPANAVVPWQDEIEVPRHHPPLAEVLTGRPIDPALRRSLENAYDRELVHLDEELSRLLEFLDAPGRRDRTYVLVTSDHGELFGEHELTDHMVQPYLGVVGVPFVLKGPGIEPGRSHAPVQSVDVFTTALELLGLDADPRQGRSVLTEPERSTVSEWYASTNGRLREARYRGRFEHDVAALEHRGYRLYEHGDGRAELYEPARDPSERRDLASRDPALVARLREELASWRREHSPPVWRVPTPHDDAELSPERLEQLRALGYAR